MAVILITHGIPAEGFQALLSAGHTLQMPRPLEKYSTAALAAMIPFADAVVAGGALPGDIIRLGTKLRIIANYGAGYDGVDVRTAASLGIPVTNTPDAVTEDTAELALGLMLAVARRIGEMNLRLRQEAPETLFGMGLHMGQSLRGKTLGIVGMGRIGSRVAQMAQALGMRVLGCSRRGVSSPFAKFAPLNALLETANIVSLHCPLTEETRGLIGREALERMKPGAILINTARGAVVDENALAEALTCGRLAGAGLDVYPDEPHIHPRLLRLPQVVCTPHIGTNTLEARTAMAQCCARQILDVLAGRQPENLVRI